eukprot:5440216-Pyramimonas_sp.AAC.1
MHRPARREAHGVARCIPEGGAPRLHRWNCDAARAGRCKGDATRARGQNGHLPAASGRRLGDA